VGKPLTSKVKTAGAALQKGWVGYLFASPWLVGFFGLTLVPMVVSLLLSFTSWRGIDLGELRWVGTANYERAGRGIVNGIMVDLGHAPEDTSGDENVWLALRNTAYYSFVSVPLGLAASLLLALLLDQKIRGISFFRTIFYMPHVIGGVATIMMWMWVFNPDFGLLNAFLRQAARPLVWAGWLEANWQPPAWLWSVRWSKPALIIMSLWGAGGAMLIFLAALQNVPQQLYEAARIDGAGRWQQFWHVTFPQISPAVFFNLVMGIIGSFQVFNAAYIITGGSGGQGRSLLFYVLYLYNKAFADFELGYASALAWILFVLILGMTLLILRSSRLWVYYGGQR